MFLTWEIHLFFLLVLSCHSIISCLNAKTLLDGSLRTGREYFFSYSTAVATITPRNSAISFQPSSRPMLSFIDFPLSTISGRYKFAYVAGQGRMFSYTSFSQSGSHPPTRVCSDNPQRTFPDCQYPVSSSGMPARMVSGFRHVSRPGNGTLASANKTPY